MKKSRKKIIIILSSILGVVSVLFFALHIYFWSYYKASDVSSYLKSDENVNVLVKSDYISFEPKSTYDTGIIFYPGAKVEYKAYAPIFNMLAQNNIYTVILKVRHNIAFLSSNKAKIAFGLTNNVSNWYLSGHSLGGVVASSYAYNHQDKVAGLILLASYSTKNLSNSNMSCISIYGSCDNVLNMKSYNENTCNLPSNNEIIELQGANHANFASYGNQKGDGVNTITREEQQKKTVNLIMKFLGNQNN